MLINNVMCLLVSNAVTLRRDKSILYYRTSSIMFTLMLIIGLSCLNLYNLNNTVALYGGLFNINSSLFIFQLFIYGISAIVIGLSGVYSKNIYIYNDYINKSKNKIINEIKNKIYKVEQYKIIEYPLLIVFILIGATFLISSNDVVSLFISIELQSYGLYLLAVSYRNSESSTNAGLMYFLLGGLSSCFILLGTALIYTNSGTTSLELLYIINKIWDSSKNYVVFSFETGYMSYALIIMIAGFLFKISAAPFHFWSPDVYDAIPTVVTSFVAIIPKLSVLTFIYSVVHYTSNTLFNADFDWRSILLLSSLLSLIIGTVLGLNQFRIKRLYAYSTISHLGFILLALSINNIESTQAFMFYLMQYSLANLNAFILLLIVGYSLSNYKFIDTHNQLKDENNSPLQLINQLKGYFQFNPIIAISLAITIYSFVGIPPLLGFFAKQMVLSAALDNGFVFMALIAVLTSVIGAVYYLNIIKQVFFYKFTQMIKSEFNTINFIFELSPLFSIILSILTMVILLFIVQPQEWLNATSIMSLLSFNP